MPKCYCHDSCYTFSETEASNEPRVIGKAVLSEDSDQLLENALVVSKKVCVKSLAVTLADLPPGRETDQVVELTLLRSIRNSCGDAFALGATRVKVTVTIPAGDSTSVTQNLCFEPLQLKKCDLIALLVRPLAEEPVDFRVLARLC